MSAALNREVVNDTAKLIMHRLVARSLAHNESLIERAKAAQARMSERFPERSFVQDWQALLARPVADIRLLLTRRDDEMRRLRLSSPFVIAEGFDFTEPVLRMRIWRAAKRLAARATPMSGESSSRPAPAAA